MAKTAKSSKKGKVVVTVNSEFVILARRDPKFMAILNSAEMAVADGKWVANSRLALGGKVHDRVTGVDLIEQLCQKSADWPVRIGFLGGFGSVAETVSKCQKVANRELDVVLSTAGDPNIGYDSRLIEQFNLIGRIDILFVAYGMGKQEFWINRMQNKLDVGVFIGVGGAFDYLANVKIRAPRLLQSLGMEWVWRLFMEPFRIWRMRVLPLFAILVIKQFFQKNIK